MTGIDIFYYIACFAIIVGTLAGIAMMSKVKTAAAGNKIGAVSILASIVLALWYYDILTVVPLFAVMGISLIVSIWWSTKVKMIAMPQMVAMLNGFGGAASAIVGGVFLFDQSALFTDITSGLAIAVGIMTLLESLVAVGKFTGKLSQKPVILPCHQILSTLLLALSVAMIGVIACRTMNLWIALTLISRMP